MPGRSGWGCDMGTGLRQDCGQDCKNLKKYFKNLLTLCHICDIIIIDKGKTIKSKNLKNILKTIDNIPYI